MNIIKWYKSYNAPSIFYKYWWRDMWYTQVSARLNPRNKWLTSKIPNTWADKDTIIEICLFESIINYVEGEQALGDSTDFFKNYRWTQTDKDIGIGWKNFYKELKKNYDIVKYKLPKMEAELKQLWNDIPNTNFFDEDGDWSNVTTSKFDYNKKYGKIDKLEKKIDDLKTEVMLWTVKNRSYMWT